MTSLVELVESKDASGFQTALQAKLSEKVIAALEGLKVEVAKNFFAGIDESKMPKPSKGHLPKKAGPACDPNEKEFDRSGKNVK